MNGKQINRSCRQKDNRFHDIIIAYVAREESSNAQACKQAELIIGAKLGAMC